MSLKKEIPILIIVLIPFIYLFLIWDGLPDTVPTHWNYKGEIDDWGPKSTTILITFLLPGLTYLLFTVIPIIDPKKKIKLMGSKYDNLKFLMTLFMSALSIFLLYCIKEQSLTNPAFLIAGIGLLYTLLGNYMKTIKANYFVGIRTPWTLEHESVWKSTHLLAGKLWFIGGLAIVLVALFTQRDFYTVFFFVVTIIISLIPVIYSYIAYRKIKIEA